MPDRPTDRWLALTAIAFPLAVMASGCGTSSGAGGEVAAACAGPTLRIENGDVRSDEVAEPPTVVLPDSFVVVGEGFRDGCDDTGGPDEGVPMTDVELTLEQEGQTWSLGVADASGAGSSSSVTWEVTSPPSSLAPMPAVLRAGRAELDVLFSIP